MPKLPDNNNRIPKQASYLTGAGRKQDFTPSTRGLAKSVKNPTKIPPTYLSSAGNNIISNQRAAPAAAPAAAPPP